MPNAYCYHRFSSKAQDGNNSLPRQRELTEKLCKANEWTIAETLEDEGRSAWKGDHLRVGKLGQFKSRVEAGEIESGSFLVIENLDRLSRQDVKIARRWIEDVTDRGITVAVCTPPILLDSDALSGSNIVSMLQYLLEAKRSTGESSRKSDLQQDNIARWMADARKGIVFSPSGPKWLKGEVGGRWQVIEERAAVVNQIYEWCASGEGPQSIATKLNASVPAWGAGVKNATRWNVGYIRDILGTPMVEGEFHPRTGGKHTGEVIYGYYPRIVPAELVERARLEVAKRKGTGGAQFSEARNLFAGRVRCGHCNDAMTRVVHVREGQQYEYLKCSGFNVGSGCTNRTLYRYDRFERAALDQILHLALDDAFFIRSDDISPLAGRLADLNKEVDRIKAQQKRLLDYVMENDEADEAKDRLTALRPLLMKTETERDRTRDDLDAARGRVSPEQHLSRVREVRDAIHSEDIEERNEARRRVRDAVQSIVSIVTCKSTPADPAARPYRATPYREITMTLAGGYMAFLFDNDGALLKKLSLQGTDLMNGIKGTGAEHIVPVIQRRAASA